ncbi:MAG: hypothetical protein F4066_04965 [Chloroflexi bacterium]|nr:hypothetical protein [Chloroflexota bacterium]MYI04195.1 hypothetical protein [Chloroflexota bacterium]
MTRALTAISVLLFLALAVVACAENPNEHVQSNEFFRPAADTRSQEQEGAASDAAAQQSQGEDQLSEQDEAGNAGEQATEQGEASEGSDEEPVPQDSQQAGGEQQEDESEEGSDGVPLQTAEDVIRRYTNPTYGYSIELICSPFCAPTSNGIDRVSFGSETGRALIGVDVFLDEQLDSEPLVRSLLDLERVEFSSIDATTTITGEKAERFNWEEDRRATGGFQVRWHAVLVRVNGLAIVLRAGAVLEDYDDVSDALERAIDSFFLPLEIAARPGRYERFDFALNYDTGDFAQEFGQPTDNPPSDQAGIFVLQSTTALKAVLSWQTLGEAFYDGDTAITQSLRDSLGIENVSGFVDAGTIDGRPARSGETETPFGTGVMMIRSYAWYCNDSGREFVLHVLDPEEPEAVALPLIAGFRCSVEDDAEEGVR